MRARDPERDAAEPPVVVLTGASAGIGRATARLLARRGARLGLIARGRDRLAATAAEVERLGGRAVVVPADVADAKALDEAAARTEDAFGPLDVWINNAMASVFSPIAATTAEEFRRVAEVTYLGTVNGTLAALRRMRPRDRGTIVQVSSTLAYRGIPLQAAYCAAKHAVLGFTDSLRCELLHDRSGVRVTMVHLPAVNTPQFDWMRNRMPQRPAPPDPLYQPEVAARGVLFAMDTRRRDHYVGASTVQALYAQRLAPGLFDRYLSRAAWEGQLDSQRDAPGRSDNLYDPPPGDPGAHGRFDDRALASSAQLWLSEHRDWLALGGGALALAGALAAGRRRR